MRCQDLPVHLGSLTPQGLQMCIWMGRSVHQDLFSNTQPLSTLSQRAVLSFQPFGFSSQADIDPVRIAWTPPPAQWGLSSRLGRTTLGPLHRDSATCILEPEAFP